MANYFKLHGATIGSTSEETLIIASGSSNFIVGSLIIANTAAATDGTVTLTIYDADQDTTFNILKNEEIDRETSREILSRPFILETNDELRITCSHASTYDVLISYLDRNRE